MTFTKMAAILRGFRRTLATFSANLKPETVRKHALKHRSQILSSILAGTVTYYFYSGYQKETIKANMVREARSIKRTLKNRFEGFASITYKGQIFMTPIDFIESMLELKPRDRYVRRELMVEDLARIKEVALRKNTNSSRLVFRELKNDGIISYNEFIFLVSILTKAYHDIEISFKMLDRNNNNAIEKHEYLGLETALGRSTRLKKDRKLNRKLQQPMEDEDDLQLPDTTLMLYFFGRQGNQTISLQQFKKFVLDLQEEMVKLEFMQFSHGTAIISDINIAMILLSHTKLTYHQRADYFIRFLAKAASKTSFERGVTFGEFKSFVKFINGMTDFKVVMRMYTQLDVKATVHEFVQAVKVCTGQELTPYLTRIIFDLLSQEGDGNLISYQHFFAVMHDRVTRKFVEEVKESRWRQFVHCIATNSKRSSDGGVV